MSASLRDYRIRISTLEHTSHEFGIFGWFFVLRKRDLRASLLIIHRILNAIERFNSPTENGNYSRPRCVAKSQFVSTVYLNALVAELLFFFFSKLCQYLKFDRFFVYLVRNRLYEVLLLIFFLWLFYLLAFYARLCRLFICFFLRALPCAINFWSKSASL